MKEPIIYKIMLHLYERDAINEDAVDITDFLKTAWSKSDMTEEFNNLNRIRYAISRIAADGYAIFLKAPSHHDLNENKAHPNGETYRCTLDNTTVAAKISTKGYDYIIEEMRRRKQDQLLENTISTNTSLQAVNASNSDLNGQTRKYYRHLQWATWVIAAATIANVLVVLLPLYCNKKVDASNQLKVVPQKGIRPSLSGSRHS